MSQGCRIYGREDLPMILLTIEALSKRRLTRFQQGALADLKICAACLDPFAFPDVKILCPHPLIKSIIAVEHVKRADKEEEQSRQKV